MIPLFHPRHQRLSPLLRLIASGGAALWLAAFPSAQAGLAEYDAAVATDTAGGLAPAAVLTQSLTFTGGPGRAFDFGQVNGDGTFECIVEGAAGVRSGYLAVGSNASSNLRLHQYANTDEVGFTQLGVVDYRFTPRVPTPLAPAHLAYVWNGAGRMELYVNGMLAGSVATVSSAFGLPTGQGWLGANPSGGEAMTGTIYRIACYDTRLDPSVLRRRAEAFLDIKNPPAITSFTAEPPTLAAGQSATLRWSVADADSLALDGADVTGLAEKTVSPTVSTTYTLEAVNGNGTSTRTLWLAVLQPAGHLIINEFMASNNSTLRDEDGEFSDWLELHNPTSQPVPLSGYSLTDKADQPRQWALPAETLPAGGFKIVFLSGKDRAAPAGEWHANFRLGKDGEYLALTGPAGIVHEFAPAFPPQEDDVSYGLTGADPAYAGYLASPTPGAANDPSLPRPAPVAFSQLSGLLGQPLSVELTCATPGASLFYRLNHAAAQPYTGPLTITASTQVQAWAEHLGQSSATTTASWVKLAPDMAGYTSPLPILVIDNFNAGTIPQKGWSGTGAGVQQVARQTAAWVAWDRAPGATASPNATPQFFSQIGIRGRGAFSSSWHEKPYNVEAWTETGAELDLPVLGMPAHSDWVLYFPDPDENKDPTLLFNTFVYDLARRLGHPAPRFRWVELFVNENGGDVSLSDRRGVYAVLEKVSRGTGRLDFQRLSADGSAGGWLLALNRMDAIPEGGWPGANGATTPQFFRTAGANRIQETTPNNPAPVGDDEPQQSNGFLNFENPNGYVINAAQRAAIEGWFKDFEDVLYDNARWRDPAQGYHRWLDADDFAGYFVFNELTKNGDGLLISMYPWKGNDGRLRMGPTWDYNFGSYYAGGGPTGSLRWRGDRLWYKRLFADPDFLQRYIDRWFTWRAGAMSHDGIAQVISDQAAEITPAKAVAQGIASASQWTQRLNRMRDWVQDRAAWVDSQYLAPPTLNVPGGVVPAGQAVTITGEGTLCHTTNGTDPRAPGGGIAPGAATGPQVVITSDTRLIARARQSSSRWSAPATALYVTDAVPATAQSLVISEIHYHPAEPTIGEIAAGFTEAGAFEFIELANISAQKISLLGVRFVLSAAGDGIAFSFNDGSQWSLAPGARLVVVKNRAAFAARYGTAIPVAGEFTDQLGNNGDALTLLDGAGGVLVSFAYSDQAPWPVEADGSGRSLTRLAGAALSTSGDPATWRPSVALGGSPGTSDTLPVPADGDLAAYAFGGQPMHMDWTESGLVITQPRLPGSDAVTAVLEYSTNLTDWEPIGAPEAVGQLLPDGRWQLKRPVPSADPNRGFLHWRLVLVP